MDFCYIFEKMVKNYIKEHHIIAPQEHIIVGVSGGADSLCLLEVLHRFSIEEMWKITAVHVHHGIRGKEADKDEQFVEEFCYQRGISYIACHYQVPLEAKLSKEGEEETGRRLRYQAFDKVLYEQKADKIAIAHHREDQAETVLFHLIRGSNLKGLCGMQPIQGNKIRPFLCVGKEEICHYLEERGILYRTDQSNFSEEYKRNYLRLRVFPLLEKVNAGAAKHMSQVASQLFEAELYLEQQTEAAMIRLGICNKSRLWHDSPIYIEKKIYEQEPLVIQKRVIYQVVSWIAGSKKDFEEQHILSIHTLFYKQPGKRIELPYNLQAKRDTSGIWLERRKSTFYKKNCFNENNKIEMILFSEEERAVFQEAINNNSLKFPFLGEKSLPKQIGKIRWRLFFFEKNALIPKNGYTKWFDYDKIATAALFRTRRAGDWFVLDASGRHKKLKQYFIDEKVPKEQRERMLLFADGSHIIWIAGGRISEEYKVRETTRVVLELRFLPNGEFWQ